MPAGGTRSNTEFQVEAGRQLLCKDSVSLSCSRVSKGKTGPRGSKEELTIQPDSAEVTGGVKPSVVT